MQSYDFCLTWNWEHDSDFIALLEEACGARGLSIFQITPNNIGRILAPLSNKEISFTAFLDRASDSDPRFIPVVQWARENAVYQINPHEKAVISSDKSAMHHALINEGIHTPYTIILPPYKEQAVLEPVDLSPLGDSFTVKPAHGGGGEGVYTEVTSLEQVFTARKKYPDDKWLLQAHIVPVNFGTRPAWYRVIYCAGEIFPCWWDTGTFFYKPVTAEEENGYRLSPLKEITATIARLTRLELFSTEIALTAQNNFVSVDYVNDQIDLRLQSKTPDGVPDYIVKGIAWSLASLVAEHRSLPGTSL